MQAEQFTYCQPWVLSWQYRKQNIIRELLGYGADILCLQVSGSQSTITQAQVSCKSRSQSNPPLEVGQNQKPI